MSEKIKYQMQAVQIMAYKIFDEYAVKGIPISVEKSNKLEDTFSICAWGIPLFFINSNSFNKERIKAFLCCAANSIYATLYGKIYYEFDHKGEVER